MMRDDLCPEQDGATSLMSAKKALLAVIVVFLGFWMFTDPGGLAHAAKAGGVQAWELAENLFRAVIRFFGALL